MKTWKVTLLTIGSGGFLALGSCATTMLQVGLGLLPGFLRSTWNTWTQALTNLLQDFLPAGVLAPQYGDQAINLTHLACHVSGLPRMPTNFAPADALNPFADYGDQRMFGFLNQYQSPRAPGGLYEYSNAFGVSYRRPLVFDPKNPPIFRPAKEPK